MCFLMQIFPQCTTETCCTSHWGIMMTRDVGSSIPNLLPEIPEIWQNVTMSECLPRDLEIWTNCHWKWRLWLFCDFLWRKWGLLYIVVLEIGKIMLCPCAQTFAWSTACPCTSCPNYIAQQCDKKKAFQTWSVQSIVRIHFLRVYKRKR